MSLARMNPQFRAEFINVFNRLFVPDPSSTTYGATPQYIKGTNLTSGGFGYVNMSSAAVAAGARTGQIVARFSF